jgi:hypothetical protein
VCVCVRAENSLSSLCSNVSHFLYELVQNCDDNSYGASVRAAVHFRITHDSVLMFNNEVGFSEDNMRALSRVGRSTKNVLDRAGFIGQKGIGFKSVFRVSAVGFSVPSFFILLILELLMIALVLAGSRLRCTAQDFGCVLAIAIRAKFATSIQSGLINRIRTCWQQRNLGGPQSSVCHFAKL